MRKIYKSLASLAALVLSSAAFAQSAAQNGSAVQGMEQMFKPEDSDLTKIILQAVFGDWEGNTSVPMMGDAMSYYNASIMLFGVLLYTFLGTISVVQTAKDGVLLGKKMSATWIPIRFVAAMALLIPLSSGYSRVQSIALNGAVLGGGAASKIWTTVASSTIEPVGALKIGGEKFFVVESTVPGSSPSQEIATNVFRAMMCVESHNAALDASGSPGERYGINRATSREPGVAMVDHIKFGSSTGQECGIFSGPSVPLTADLKKTVNQAPSSTSSVGAWQTIVSSVSAARPISSDTRDISDISNRQVNAIVQMSRQLGPLARAQATPDGANADGTPIASTHKTKEEVQAQIDAAAKSFDDAIRPALVAMSNNMASGYQQYVDQTAKYGWMMAGASIYRVSATRSKISEAISTASNPKFETGSDSSDVIDSGAASLTDAALSDQNALERFGMGLALKASRAVTIDPTNPTHAIVQLKQNGDTLVNIGSTVFMTALASKWVVGDGKDDGFAMSAIKSVPILGKVAETVTKTLAIFASIFMALGGLLLLCGFTMAYIIPLLPFITSIGNIVGWLMATFSAVIAAPVWMAAHFHPNGDELVGRGAGGYMIMVESVFRPVFLVLGLVGGYKIADAAIRLFSLLSPVAMSGLQVYTATGIMTLLFYVGFNVVATLAICRTCMKFSDSLQNKVFTWIGGAHAGYDAGQEMSGSIERSTQGFQANSTKAYGAVGAVIDKMAPQRSKKPETPSDQAAVGGAVETTSDDKSRG